jgi:hypothetical protein
LFSELSERPFEHPDALVERLVPIQKANSGIIGKLARQLAEEHVRKCKSLGELSRRLREARRGETDLMRIEALKYVRIRAEALEAVFPNL